MWEADTLQTRRIWCERAALPTGPVAGVRITIVDGLIERVDSQVERDDDDEFLGGFTMPGFANAHSHAFHRALRGRTHGGAGDFWKWREQMYDVAARLTPDNYLPLARAVFGEMLLAGYTCVGEFHYVHHAPAGESYVEPNAMGHAIIEAARQSGIRLTLLDACYLHGGINVGVSDQQRRYSDGSALQWISRVEQLIEQVAAAGSPNVRVGAAIHSVRAVDPAAIAAVATFARSKGLPLHAHVSEQLAENEQSNAAYGMSPTRLLAQNGALTEDFTAVHATHLGSDDVQLYAAAGCTCCLCPTTESDLGDGIGPSDQFRDAGVRMAIGSDQHAVIDPFGEMRGIELHERLATQRRGANKPLGLFASGTYNGYRGLGWHNGGNIESGALADLTTIGLDSVRLSGTRPADLIESMIFSATASDVRNVIVGGVTVVAAGAHVGLDVASELRRAIGAIDDGHSRIARQS